MSPVLLVARREIQAIFRNKAQLVSGILFSLFAVVQGLTMGTVAAPGLPTGSLDGIFFYVFALQGLLVGWVFTANAFLREKRDGVVETLLCTPLRVEQIWAGKTLGVTTLACAMVLPTAVLVTLGWNVFFHRGELPSATAVAHLLVNTPLIVGFAVGGMGFLNLLLGMRENMIVNFVFMFMLFGGVAVLRVATIFMASVEWYVVAPVAVMGAGLVALVGYLARFLSKERIVRTIPD